MWAAALLLISALHAQHTPLRVRARTYVHHTFGSGAWVRSGAGAGFNQLRNHPHEWGRGAAGFGCRFASGFGQHAIKSTLEFGVGALRHEVPGYTPSHRHGAWARTRYVIANTFLVRREGHRGRSIAAGRLAGDFGGGMMSRLWQPPAMHTLGSGLTSGGISLGVDTGMNAFREFWPDLHRKLRRHKRRHE